ncbi:hypothetical protein DSECCO2_151390 [anaerobic digester metagenome]
MFKKIFTLMIATCCLLSFNATAFAKDINDSVHPDSNVPNIIVKDFGPKEIIVPDTENSIADANLYTYAWRIKESKKYTRGYGSWREGPTGKGPGTLDINKGNSVNRSFTVSISGDYEIGKGTIGAALGVEIGETEEYGTSYSISLEKNERKTIIFRPKYQRYRVISEYIRMNNTTGSSQILKTQTAYVDEFIDWEYDWRNGY